METLDNWLIYAVGFLAINLLVLPGLFWLAVAMSRKLTGLTMVPVKQLFVDYAYSLVPLGLLGWIAFSFSFVFVNGSYAVSVLSDPFGWGWDLFGTRAVPWIPLLPQLVSLLQIGLLTGALVFSIITAYRIGRQHTFTHTQAWRGMLPISGFITTITLAFLWLYLG